MRTRLAVVCWLLTLAATPLARAQHDGRGGRQSASHPAAPPATKARGLRPLGGRPAVRPPEPQRPLVQPAAVPHAPPPHAPPPAVQQATPPAKAATARRIIPRLLEVTARIGAAQLRARERLQQLQAQREVVHRELEEATRSLEPFEREAHEAELRWERARQGLDSARAQREAASAARRRVEAGRASAAAAHIWDQREGDALETALVEESAAVTTYAAARTAEARAVKRAASVRERVAVVRERVTDRETRARSLEAQMSEVRAQSVPHGQASVRIQELTRGVQEVETEIAAARLTVKQARRASTEASTRWQRAQEAHDTARTELGEAIKVRQTIERGAKGARVRTLLGDAWRGFRGEMTPLQTAQMAEATALTAQMQARAAEQSAAERATTTSELLTAAEGRLAGLEALERAVQAQLGEATAQAASHARADERARELTTARQSLQRDLAEQQRSLGPLESELEVAQAEWHEAREALETSWERLARAGIARQRIEYGGSRGARRSAAIWERLRHDAERTSALEAAILEESTTVIAFKRARETEATAGRTAASMRERAATTREQARAHEARARELEAATAQATEEATGAERALDDEVRRFEQSTLEDQHVPTLSQAGRTAHERASQAFQVRTGLVSKPGELSQDAFATNPVAGRFAVADGVTNSRFAGEFARELVRRWAEHPPARGESFIEWLRPIQRAWAAEVAPARAEVEGQWFNRGAQWVAHATFVGVALERARGDAGATLRTLALGDAVLLHVRQNRVVRAFPNERAAQFLSDTQALPSAGELTWQPREIDLPVEAGDEVFMLSDAIAAWTLREVEAGRNPFAILRRLDTPALMKSFVEGHRARARRGNRLEVDDTTIVRFVVPAE